MLQSDAPQLNFKQATDNLPKQKNFKMSLNNKFRLKTFSPLHFTMIFRKCRIRNTKLACSLLVILSVCSVYIWYLMDVGQFRNQCSAENNIVFLKTHKTAGSSIQNIFMRYADQNNLFLVLPYKGNYLGHPDKFQPWMAPQLIRGYHYNIFTHHSRFNYAAIEEVMPSDTVFLTILRDPATLFESLYDYYSLEKIYKIPINQFALLNTTNLLHQLLIGHRHEQRVGRNQMSFDLGISMKMFDNDQEILEAAKLLDEQFHLVMISEFMDESLVLLKNLLCWPDYKDVATFKLNSRKEKTKAFLSEEVKSKLHQINRADQLLYNYFYDRFLERVQQFGKERMAQEVAILQATTADLYQQCLEDDTNYDINDFENSFAGSNTQLVEFRLKESAIGNTRCENMIKDEMLYTQEIFSKQKSYLRFIDRPIGTQDILSALLYFIPW